MKWNSGEIVLRVIMTVLFCGLFYVVYCAIGKSWNVSLWKWWWVVLHVSGQTCMLIWIWRTPMSYDPRITGVDIDFAIGQKVWVLENNTPLEKEVTEVQVFFSRNRITVNYRLFYVTSWGYTTNYMYNACRIYQTRQDLANSLLKK